MKLRVDLRLEALQPLDILRPLRAEGVEHALVVAGGMDPALDAVAGDEVVEAEGRRDHADRADDRVRIDVDAIGRRRQPVAARGRDVLDEGMDRDLQLVGEPADPRRDQARLRRAAAGRVDGERDRLRLAAPERRLDQRRQPRIGERRGAEAAAAADDALEPQDRHPIAPPEEREGVLHRSDVGRHRTPRKPAARFTRSRKRRVGRRPAEAGTPAARCTPCAASASPVLTAMERGQPPPGSRPSRGDR